MIKIMCRQHGLCFLLLLFFVFISAPAVAAGPQAEVQQRIDQILELVRSDNYNQAEPMQRTEMLLDATEELFDRQEVAQRVLAVHWKRFSPQQRQEFVQLFTDFLKHNYAQKIGAYTFDNERVVFTDELLSDSRAIVKTLIVTSDKRIPVDYALLEKNGRWQVYDARIEGVSLVQNYRSQFNNILIKNNPDVLLDMLRERIQGKEGESTS
jgi:phospholipid transport system substrate-binding protein